MYCVVQIFQKIVTLCEWLQRTTQHGIHESWHITGIRTMTRCIRSRHIRVIFVHPTRKYCFSLVPTGGCSLIYIRSACYPLPSEGLMNHSFKSKNHHWPDWWCGHSKGMYQLIWPVLVKNATICNASILKKKKEVYSYQKIIHEVKYMRIPVHWWLLVLD